MTSKEHKFQSVNRRDFLKLCATIASVMGVGKAYVAKIAYALEQAVKRPSLVWLHFAECTGCSESLIKSKSPTTAQIVLDILSIDYHETIMAAAGHQAEEILDDILKHNKGKYLCVMEGAVPTAANGNYLTIGGKTGLELAKEMGAGAIAILNVGSCAFDGGVVAMKPNPSKATGTQQATGLPAEKFINISGCPPNPINILAVVVYYLTKGALPELDSLRRPKMAYGETIHEHCERLKFFEEEKFVKKFGTPEAEKGYCLYYMGCKGPETYNNCPTVKWCDEVNWCVGAGAPCMGCSELNFPDKFGPFYKPLA